MAAGSFSKRFVNALSVLAMLLVTGIAGCSSKPGNVWSSVPNIAPASPVVFQQRTGSVALAPVTVTLPERRSIGSVSRNVDCWVLVRPLTDADFPPAPALTGAAANALTAAHLTVSTVSSGDVASAQGNDYLLTATVPGAHADMCNNAFMENAPEDVDLELDVSWKLWSVRENRVVFETSTSGIGHSSNRDQSLEPAAALAMADAVARLLQTVTAQQYLTFGHITLPQPMASTAYPVPVSAGPETAPSLPGHPDVAVVPQAAGAGPMLLIPVADSAPAGETVAKQFSGIGVTVAQAGTAVAGFIISPAGYILGNSSVLTPGSTIIVTFGSGEKIEADVIRGNAELGLSLLKLKTPVPEALANAALPVEPRKADAGAHIYALSAQGAVAGRLGAAVPGGGNAVALAHPVPGSPVLDPRGGVLGVIVSGGNAGKPVMMPIAAVFRRLRMAASFEGG